MNGFIVNSHHICYNIQIYTFLDHACRQARCGYIVYCLCVCLFVRLQIFPPRIKQAVSNFSGRFLGFPGKQSLIFVNFTHQEAPNRTNRPARPALLLGYCDSHAYQVRAACGRIGSACVDIRQSPKTNVYLCGDFIYLLISMCHCLFIFFSLLYAVF